LRLQAVVTRTSASQLLRTADHRRR
jgi:hypothetical protein